jgi:hypothetical protein
MIRPATTFSLALALSLTMVAASPAAVPSPANSSTPACMVFCPMGDVFPASQPFTVVVRDLANVPVAGSSVVIDLSGCPAAYICTPIPGDPYTTNLLARTLSRVTDGSGTAVIPARVGGTAPAGCVKVYADGVLLKSYALASPDQNGNGITSNLYEPGDDPLFAAKMGTADPTADFDCDGGLVDADDQLIFNWHAAHSCQGFIDPVLRRSWGSLKSHYR